MNQNESMKPGTRDAVEDVTKWVKGIFKRSWMKHDVRNLVADFSEGVLIIHLAEALICRKLPLLFSKPSSIVERVGNIELALQAFKDDKVEIPGIFAHDIANGDVEITVMLCYVLKHHYSEEQPSQGWLLDAEETTFSRPASSDASTQYGDNHLDFVPFEKEDISLFDWVSSLICREVVNYHLFKDGFVLCKLINILSPRGIPKKVISSASDLERIKLALGFAFHELKIRAELQPKEVLLGKNRPKLRSFLDNMRKIHAQQMRILESQAKRHLFDGMSFKDQSLRDYSFYDLFYDKESRPRARHDRDEGRRQSGEDILVSPKGIVGTRQVEKSLVLSVGTGSDRGALDRKREILRSPPATSGSTASNEQRLLTKSKRDALNAQLNSLRNSIHGLRTKAEPTNHTNGDYKSCAKLTAVIEDDLPPGRRDSTSDIARAAGTRCGGGRVAGAEKSVTGTERSFELGRKDVSLSYCKTDDVTEADVSTERFHCKESREISNEDKNEAKAEEVSPVRRPSRTSCSSQSSFSDEATRYVRLNSRAPKGSADH